MNAPRSLQLRLALALGLAVTILWLAAASFTAEKLRHEMDGLFDAALKDAAQRILPLAMHSRRAHRRDEASRDDERRDRRGGPARAERIARLHKDDRFFTWVVRDRKGETVLRSANADKEAFPPFTREGFRQTATHRLYYDAAGRDGLTIAVAEPLSHRTAMAREMLLSLGLPLVIVIPLSLAAIFFAVRTSLRPVRRLRADLAQRGARNLAALSDRGLPSELEPIVQGMNQLLDRLRAAFEAERSFAANAAHELRTPVAGAIAQAQRLRAETKDASAAERAKEIETTLKRLNLLSEKLMQLARAEGARLRTDTPADMRPILKLVADDFARIGAAPRLHLEMPDEPVLSDLERDAFGILCRNLIENALKHGRAGEPVDIALSQAGILAVANACPPVAEEDLARLTTRFARASDKKDGSGLGLAIVRTIAERGGGELAFASPIPGKTEGFEVRFTLPRSEAAPA
ncbi:ATP-binding protein [Afifella sp. JA880]|uniref:sensor histidine kinase n=1 Tax=Afifella sp. JA880 TaxID=2975280 RepID=UPI0021BA6560|nr:ATP-binding protein [Afifella sp. JA880]MCT8267128.1 ATP-binding protein [Afifella sp. JA880]